MPDELDADLQGLLDELDERDEFLETPEEKPEPKPEEPKQKTRDEAMLADLQPSSVVVRPAEDFKVEDIRKYDESPTELEEVEIAAPEVPPLLQKHIQRMDDVTNEVLQACRSDRQETQGVINTCQAAINDAQTNGHPPARMWVDALVKSVEVKAGINSTAVKIVEANTKLIAATKAGVQINQQINTGGNASLEDVLNNPLEDGDEY